MKHVQSFMIVVAMMVSAPLLAKSPSPVQQRIAELKASGQPVGGDLWHAAEQEFLARQTELISIPPRLDDGGNTWQSATAISANPYSDAGTTIGKGNEGLIPSCLTDGSDTAEDAWYVLTTTDSILLTVWTTCADNGPPSYDTRLGLFSSTQVLLACNDDADDCGAPNYQSRIEEVALMPGTYYVCVDGYDGDSGPYVLNAAWEIGAPCVGSRAETAEVIPSLPFTDTGTTVDECDDIEIACELGGDNTAPDYWYRLTLTSNVYLDVRTTCNAGNFDTKLAILDENSTQIFCNDDDPFCPTHQSFIDDAPLSAGTYYIVVDGWRNSEGSYEINITSRPYNPTGVTELRPDISIRLNDLYDNDIVTNIVPGRTHMRLSNGTPNDGEGDLYLYGVFPPESDSTQDVRQRIRRTDGSFYDRDAGTFVYHPAHDHIHLADWCIYRLREVLPDSGVGDVVMEGEKTSFCIIDLAVFNPDNRYFDPEGHFHSCSSSIQGISAGWVDIYDKTLPGQYIDVTDVPAGIYWLEAEADPDDHILEMSETNNIGRVLVTVGSPEGLLPDRFEPNNDRLVVDGRPVGGNNSPNFGPCDPQLITDSLTVHSSNDADYYKFYMPEQGGADDFVRINFVMADGDLDMRLLNSTGQQLAVSEGVVDEELISMNARAEGWYYVHVYGYDGATNPNYRLTIDPSANSAPTITVLNPPAGNVIRIHGQETYNATWSTNDAENDDRWVTVYLNTVPELNGDEVMMPTSLHTPRDITFHTINSAYVDEGTYWVYCSITDGGTTTGDWSEGTLTFIAQVDVDPLPSVLPFNFYLAQNYPNPFNPQTTISFGVERAGPTNLTVFNMLGQEVITLVDQTLQPGHYHAQFDGSSLATGAYLYRLVSNGKVSVQKMLLLK